MSRSIAPPLTDSSGSAARAGPGDDSDLRAQLFASQRKIGQQSVVSRASDSLAATESPVHPAPSVGTKSAVKSPIAVPPRPAPPASATGTALSPAIDNCDMTTNASMESLLEELQRRKTHNVRCHRRALSVRFLTRFACVAQKGCASRKGKGCCG